jgi:hypothetical protein
MSIRVRSTDPYYYPYAIVSKRRGTPKDDGFELHFLETGPKVAWQEHAQALREGGEFEWVRFTTMNFWDDETGEPLGN